MMDEFHIYQIAEYSFHLRMPVSTSKCFVYSYVSTLCDSISSYKHKIDFIYIYCDILCTSEHLAVMEPYCYKTKKQAVARNCVWQICLPPSFTLWPVVVIDPSLAKKIAPMERNSKKQEK